MCVRNSFENKIFWKRIIKQSLKSLLYFCFQTLSLLMDKIIKNKRGLELGPVALQATKQVQKNSFISYVLSDQVWWCNIKWFFSYSKNYICKFMQANSWHHSTSICPFESLKFGKETKNTQKFEYLENLNISSFDILAKHLKTCKPATLHKLNSFTGMFQILFLLFKRN